MFIIGCEYIQLLFDCEYFFVKLVFNVIGVIFFFVNQEYCDQKVGGFFYEDDYCGNVLVVMFVLGKFEVCYYVEFIVWQVVWIFVEFVDQDGLSFICDCEIIYCGELIYFKVQGLDFGGFVDFWWDILQYIL